jgi:hypothetical protein
MNTLIIAVYFVALMFFIPCALMYMGVSELFAFIGLFVFLIFTGIFVKAMIHESNNQ